MLEHAARARYLTIDAVARPAEVLPECLAAGVVLDHVETQVGVAEPSRGRDRRLVEQPTQPATLRARIDVRAVELGARHGVEVVSSPRPHVRCPRDRASDGHDAAPGARRAEA